MLTLAIDTSTKICSVGLYDDILGIIGETNIYVKKNHSNILMKLIDELFKNTFLDIKNIDRIAVSKGPGSFTGVRIALAVAKGFAISLKKPLYAINELDILEATVNKTNFKIIPLIDARKERVYFKKNNEYGSEELKNILSECETENEKFLFVGDGAVNYQKIIKEILGDRAEISEKFNSISRAGVLAELSLKANEENIYTLEPEYISKSQAEREKEEKEGKI